MNISRHNADLDDIQSDYDFEARLLEKSIKNIHKAPANLGTLARNALSYAGYQCILDPNSIQLWRALRIAAYSLTSVCELASLPEGEYEVFAGEGDPVMLPAGVNSYSYGLSWLHGFYLGVACRESHLNDRLAEIPVAVLKQSSSRNDEYLYLQIEALQSFWKGAADTPQRVIEAMKATDPELVKVGTVDAALNIAVPEIDLLFRLLENDSVAFNESLIKALECHKKHWSEKNFKNDTNGFIAVGILGLVSIAYERGMTIEVESDYIPKYIFQGDFLK
ncbi:MAG: immunity 49 family protein [Betaproteobacteria bacterium]